ncbi:hypothetical protein ElyMa_004774800 [Elysia marginata]|uniref:Uncharacterized protein n=1 Tax=Elysia marginata TaxID=1093978 RepID=A0AAV4IE36_9GAST|nr:hypothetical protein ElyMa_004774800 [Elysia marginata]
MHILFHLGGILFAQKSNLLSFVGTHKTGLKGDLKVDLENPLITVQLQALGLVGKVITGPWMTKFYSNKSNLDMVPRIKEGKDFLDMWCEDPSKVAHPEQNIFGEPLNPSDDPVLSALIGAENITLTNVLSKLLTAIRSVFVRQLSRYLDPADLAELSEQQLLAASSAPSHNMASERALGMADAQWKSAPNATKGFLNGKVKSNLNKTLEWLEQRSDREELVSFAVSEGYQARQRDNKRKAVLERDKIIGTLFEHVWFNLDKGEESWYGRASEVETDEQGGRGKKKKKTVCIGYWSKTDLEANSEDYSIPLEDILVDLLLGDLYFIN